MTAAAVALALASGCGGSGQRQDAGEDAATYPVVIASDSFPARQALAERSQMRIAVRNVGDHTIPNLAVTIEADGSGTAVEAFGRALDEPGNATQSRPVWVVDEGPVNGDTASPNTWALGPLRPNRTATFVWKVAAVRSGHYVLTYRLAGSLTGRSQLRLENGGIPRGSFTVDVSQKAAKVHVTPDGRIVTKPPT